MNSLAKRSELPHDNASGGMKLAERAGLLTKGAKTNLQIGTFRRKSAPEMAGKLLKTDA